MQIRQEIITPNIAKDLLERNLNNRRLNSKTVAYYKDQMLQGKWRENGETLKIAEDGTLLDGQHRLAAIVESALAVPMMVARGVDPSVVVTIDTGRVRGPADHLAIWGIKGGGGSVNVTVLAAAAVICMGFDRNGKYARKFGKVPPWEIIEYVEKNRGLQESAARIPQSAGKLCPLSVCVACHYLFSTYYGPGKAEIFFNHFISAAELKRGNPILALRQRLMELRSSRFGFSSSTARSMLLYYFIQAFKAWNEGRELKQMLYKSGSTPDLEETL